MDNRTAKWPCQVVSMQPPDFSDPQCSAALVKHLDASARRKWRLLNRSCCEDVYGTVKTLNVGDRYSRKDEGCVVARAEAVALAKQDVERIVATAKAVSSLLKAASRQLHATKLSAISVEKVTLGVQLDVDADIALEATKHLRDIFVADDVHISIHARRRTGLPSNLLSKLPNLHTLSCTGLPMSSLSELPAGLQLRRLDIGSTDFSLSESVDQLRLLPLQSLTIPGNKMDTEDAEALSTLAPTLQELQLKQPCFVQPVPGLADLTGLRSLSFGPVMDITTNTLSHLAAVLPAMTRLTKLDLTGLMYMDTRFKEEAAEEDSVYHALGQAFRHLPNLEELLMAAKDEEYDLFPTGGNWTGPAAYQAMFPGLAAARPPLQRLDVTRSMMGAPGMAALAPALAAFEGTLQVLMLGRSVVCAAGARDLAPALGRLTALRTLDLGHNVVGAGGMVALAPALAQLQQLQGLCLCLNRMGAAGACALAAHVTAMTSLQQLLLGANRLGDAGAEELRPALSCLTALKRLDLGSNDLGVATAGLGRWKAAVPSLEQIFTGEKWVDSFEHTHAYAWNTEDDGDVAYSGDEDEDF